MLAKYVHWSAVDISQATSIPQRTITNTLSHPTTSRKRQGQPPLPSQQQHQETTTSFALHRLMPYFAIAELAAITASEDTVP